MPEGEPKEFNLTQALNKLLDFQAKQESDSVDTILMLSLLNLLGIIGLINKQVSPAVVPQTGTINPLISMLSSILAGQQQERGNTGAGPGKSQLNPAMLLNLLGSLAGKAPDSSSLLKMFSSMVEGFQGSPGGSGEQQETSKNTTPPKKQGVVKELLPGPIKWDSRLGTG